MLGTEFSRPVRRHGMSPFPFVFEASLERFGVGKLRVIWYNVLFLPEDFASATPFVERQTVRVEGEIAEVPVAGAWMPTGDGRRWFIVAPHVFKTADVRLGDAVEMRFRIDDQNRVDVPDALTHALHLDQDAGAAWEALTPGKRRAHAHRVASAKTGATIERRVREIVAALKDGESVRS